MLKQVLVSTIFLQQDLGLNQKICKIPVFQKNVDESFIKLCLLNLRRVTDKLNFGECLSLDADNLPSAVYLSPVETPPKSNDGYFMSVQF